jgi:hypothetical protein
MERSREGETGDAFPEDSESPTRFDGFHPSKMDCTSFEGFLSPGLPLPTRAAAGSALFSLRAVVCRRTYLRARLGGRRGSILLWKILDISEEFGALNNFDEVPTDQGNRLAVVCDT